LVDGWIWKTNPPLAHLTQRCRAIICARIHRTSVGKPGNTTRPITSIDDCLCFQGYGGQGAQHNVGRAWTLLELASSACLSSQATVPSIGLSRSPVISVGQLPV
jgi:hypothetical protein